MTVQQFEKCEKIMNEIKPVKEFLTESIEERYCGKSVFKWRISFAIRGFRRRFGLHTWYKDYKLPEDLQERIVKTIEEYVDEKERELEQI